MDRLIVDGIRAECCLGVFEWERQQPQAIWIDVELAIDAAAAAARDDVQETIDYGRLVTSVKHLAQSKSYVLLETLAEAIASLILREFGTSQVRVRVKKKALPGIGYAAVEVERRGARRGRTARPTGLRRRRSVKAGAR